MESTCKFERIFFKMLKEDNIAGAGGALGTGERVLPCIVFTVQVIPGSGDWYATRMMVEIHLARRVR